VKKKIFTLSLISFHQRRGGILNKEEVKLEPLLLHRKRTFKPQGFSLIEAIFAVLIIAAGLLGIVTVHSNVLYTNSNEEASTLAVHLAE
jgi:hypothetical protein